MLQKPVFYDIENQIENVYQLIAERPKVNTATKYQFIKRAIELGLFEVVGDYKNVKITSILKILNEYLLFDNSQIIYTTRKIRQKNKVMTEYLFTVIEIS